MKEGSNGSAWEAMGEQLERKEIKLTPKSKRAVPAGI